MTVYEYEVEFTQYDEYEGKEISERTILYFRFTPEASDIRDRLSDKGYDVCQLFEYVMLREIQDKCVTYDKGVNRGYIYLSEFLKHEITCTEDLPESYEIMLDFGKEVPIIGIEVEGETARKIERIAGEKSIFKKELTSDGKNYYSFRLSNKIIKRSIYHPNVKTTLFHFSDDKCQDFIGIDIFETKSYSEEFLIGD